MYLCILENGVTAEHGSNKKPADQRTNILH